MKESARMIANPTPFDALLAGSPVSDAVLLIRLADRRFGLPLAAVERVMPMAFVLPLPESQRDLIGVLNLHGEILPVIDVRPRLGLPTPALLADQRLVLITGSERFLLWVDAIEEVLPAADAQSTVPSQVASPLIPRVIRLGDELVPVLALSALAPRTVPTQ
jgi:chemotaxis signal transduction protein